MLKMAAFGRVELTSSKGLLDPPLNRLPISANIRRGEIDHERFDRTGDAIGTDRA
jgi:hypothetical protein